MASSKSMEDEAFSERVKKTFGSLFASIDPSPASLSNPLWSLTDSEVQKKQWRRDIDTSRDSNPCSSSFEDFLSHARENSRKNLKNYRSEFKDGELKDLGVDIDDDEDDKEGCDGQKDDIDHLDVKASIGLDSTLDNEAEEDAYDKVALGRENAGDRLYMKDATDSHDSHFSSQDNLPGVVGSREKDPRANRRAARMRLKEDDEEAATQFEVHIPAQDHSTSEKEFAKSAERHDKLKPILKRKEHESTSKPSKRVRFDPSFIKDDERSGEVLSDNTSSGETITQVDGSAVGKKVSQVPGYVQNPSGYTRYSFDSTDDMSDKSNAGAYLGFVEMMRETNNAGSQADCDVPIELPKSIAFVPKKKSDASLKAVHSKAGLENGNDVNPPPVQSTFIDVAAEETEGEVNDMEVDEPEVNGETDKCIAFKKQARQYRTKPVADEPA